MIISKKERLEILEIFRKLVIREIKQFADDKNEVRDFRLRNNSYRIGRYAAFATNWRDKDNVKKTLLSYFSHKSNFNNKEAKKYRPYLQSIRCGNVYIRFTRKNLLMTLTNEKMRVVFVKTTGAIKKHFYDEKHLYKGKAKKGLVAEQHLCRLISSFSWRKKLRFLNIIIVSQTKQKEFFNKLFVKGLKGSHKTKNLIRKIYYKNTRPHGYVRKRHNPRK